MNRRAFVQSAAALALAPLPAQARAPIPLHDQPIPLLTIRFQDEFGRKVTLADFAGRVVLLNIWATWCPPCLREIPALDRLQAQMGGTDFSVIPLAIDQGGSALARRFFDKAEVAALTPYWGEDLRIKMALAVYGLPTSLLIDRQGQEIGRLSGPVAWDGPEALAQMRRVLAQ